MSYKLNQAENLKLDVYMGKMPPQLCKEFNSSTDRQGKSASSNEWKGLILDQHYKSEQALWLRQVL